MPNRIREETDDVIILDTDVSRYLIGGIFGVIVGVSISILSGLYFFLLFAVLGGGVMILGLSQANESITIDKKIAKYNSQENQYNPYEVF